MDNANIGIRIVYQLRMQGVEVTKDPARALSPARCPDMMWGLRYGGG